MRYLPPNYYQNQDFFYNMPPQGQYYHYANSFSQHYNPYQTPYTQFAKPKQPVDWFQSIPEYAELPPPTNAKPKGFLSFFQDDKGNLDLDKMLTTVGKAADTFQQLSPLVQQMGSIMKNFR